MDDTTVANHLGGAEGLPKFFVAWGAVNRAPPHPKLLAMPSHNLSIYSLHTQKG